MSNRVIELWLPFASCVVPLPRGAEVLVVGGALRAAGDLSLRVHVLSDPDQPSEPRRFHVAELGEPVPAGGRYVGRAGRHESLRPGHLGEHYYFVFDLGVAQ